MLPLSSKKRRRYFFLLAFIFVSVIPVLIFYARGYRLTDTLKISRIGGIYVSTMESGLNVYMNDKFIRTVGVFQKSVLIQNLKPGIYEIAVSKDGYQTWKKALYVFPETVTEARSFSIKEDLSPKLIPEFISINATTSTTTITSKGGVSNIEYERVAALFADTSITRKLSTTTEATSTDVEKIFRKVVVTKINNLLSVAWSGDIESAPSYFCQNNVCQKEILIDTRSSVKDFDFFPGRDDLLIVSLQNGVFVIEIDNRSAQNIQKIFEGKNLMFRIEGSNLFIKDKKVLYSISL